MIALSQEKFLEYAQELNRIYANPTPSTDAMLRLIKTICEEGDYSPSESGRITKIDLIWQVATTALGGRL